jgi:hypothetical protein
MNLENQHLVYSNVNLEYSICTAPRVGSFYLQDRILQHTGIYVKKYHSRKDNKMITIVRDPIEMLTSKLAMTAFYDKKNQTMDNIRAGQESTVDLEIYLSSLDKVDVDKDFYIMIDYKDLVENPFETTLAVTDIMGLQVINQDYKENSIRDYSENSHIVSSKNVNEYKEIRSYVEKLDLSSLYEFYEKALTKCIKLR